MPRLKLQEAIELVARLAGWRGAPSDGRPGAECVEQGMRQLVDLVCGWRCHAQHQRQPPAGQRSEHRSRYGV